jgi:hypothetical protein
MRHLAQDEIARRAVRMQICPTCSQRPPRSESLGPRPRSCEPTCAIFTYLPTLQRLVAEGDSRFDSLQRALRDEVCCQCTLSPSHGDYCSDMLARTCPLSRYARDVVAVLERLPRRNVGSTTGQVKPEV